MADAERWRIVAPLRPRFRDTDAMGHINNAVYITYLEVARQEYWREFQHAANYKDVPFILAHVTIDFRSEALVHEELELCIRCSHIGTRSFGFEYAIREAKTHRVVVEARTVQAFYDYERKVTMPCPPELRTRFEAFEGRSLSRAVRT